MVFHLGTRNRSSEGRTDMAAEERNVFALASFFYSYDPTMAEEIDRLRRKMNERVQEEKSLTADPVIELSRELDVIIYEYLKQAQTKRGSSGE
jgi:hypothetical protein